MGSDDADRSCEGGKAHGVSDDTDGVSCGKSREAAAEASREMHEAGVERVALLRIDGARNEDWPFAKDFSARWRRSGTASLTRDNEAVDTDDAGHDLREKEGDQGLMTNTRTQAKAPTTGMTLFMIRSGRKVPRPAIPIPDLEVPYAAPTAEGEAVSQGLGRAPRLRTHY